MLFDSNLLNDNVITIDQECATPASRCRKDIIDILSDRYFNNIIVLS